MAAKFIALKTDIVKSRKIENRSQFQEHFLDTAKQVNQLFGGCFQSEFIITHGDEAQALIKPERVAELYGLIQFLLEAVQPVELRFGLGYGTLSTRLQATAIGMDGEAWLNAKSAIETAKKTHQSICLKGFNPDFEPTTESFLNLLLFLHSHWTDDQLEVIKLIRQGLKQSEIAASLKVSEAAISKRLSAAGWRLYNESSDRLKPLLSRIAD